MFLKNSCSSEGVGDGVCACKATVVASVNKIMPKRHCDRLFLRMLIPPCIFCRGGPPWPPVVWYQTGGHGGPPLQLLSVSPNTRPGYLPTTSTTKEPGLMLRCGRPPGVVAGVSTYSAALRKIFLVFGSKAIVRA